MRNPLAAIFLIILFLVSKSWGGVDVRPSWVFVKYPERSGLLMVTNPTEEDRECWIEFKYGYPASDSGETRVHFVDSLQALGGPYCVGWLRPFPRRFVLKPKESQNVRIVASPPSGLRSGEYWAYVAFSSKPAAKQVASGGKSERVDIQMEFIHQVLIPFHYRMGEVTTGLRILNLQMSQNDTALHVFTKLTREGNASYWGTADYRLLDQAGKRLAIYQHTIGVYNNRAYDAFLNISGVPSGEYVLEITYATKRPDVRSEFLIRENPLKKMYPVKIMGINR